MNTSASVIVNVGLKDKPANVAAYLEDLRGRGIVAATSRGAAQGSGKSVARTEIGPWEKAWCQLKKVSRVRRTEGRNFEQQAFYNFETYEPDSKPKGLHAPRF